MFSDKKKVQSLLPVSFDFKREDFVLDFSTAVTSDKSTTTDYGEEGSLKKRRRQK